MLKLVETVSFSLLRRSKATFSSGLNVITGESGAGKSLLFDAIVFALGGRAHRTLLAEGASTCNVVVEVDIDESTAISLGAPWITGKNRIERSYTSGGRSKVKVNGSSTTVSDVARLSELCFDFTGQFEGQILLNSQSHGMLLDEFGGADVEDILSQYQPVFDELRTVERHIELLQRSAEQRSQEIEYLKYQTEELEAAAVQPGEKHASESTLKLLQHAEQICAAGDLAVSLLTGDDDSEGAYDLAARSSEQLGEIIRLMGEDSDSGSAAAGLKDRLDVFLQEIELAAREITDLISGVEVDSDRQQELSDRLDLIHRLERKYNCMAEDLPGLFESLSDRLMLLQDDSQSPEALQKKSNQLRNQASSLAAALHKTRLKAAAKLTDTARGYLDKLGFSSVEFLIEVTTADQFTRSGSDEVEFLVSLNPGEPARPIQQVASGGESSRLMLALKAALSVSGGSKVLLFDEIEAGLGGEAARMLGEVLLELASSNQLVAITHLPVVAALGTNHLVAEKTIAGGRSNIHFNHVDGEDRRSELSRMLGREGGSEELALVSRLLGGAD